MSFSTSDNYSDTKCSILIIGPTGSGKSTLLNYLAGDNELFKVGESYKPITPTLEKKETLLRNSKIKTILIDTPGAFSAFDELKEYYEKIKQDLNRSGKIQQFVFLTFNGVNFAESRAQHDLKTISIADSLLGDDCWNNVYLVMTKMDLIENEKKKRILEKSGDMSFYQCMNEFFDLIIKKESINPDAKNCTERILYIDNKPENLLKEIKQNINLNSFKIQSGDLKELEKKVEIVEKIIYKPSSFLGSILGGAAMVGGCIYLNKPTENVKNRLGIQEKDPSRDYPSFEEFKKNYKGEQRCQNELCPAYQNYISDLNYERAISMRRNNSRNEECNIL